MKAILTAALCGAMLAGCAEGYDKSAMPVAAAAAQEASNGCRDRRAAHQITTHSQFEACELSAARGFFTALKMQRMDRFEAYAVSMRTLAADRDAGRASDQQARSRGRAIVREFLASCDCKPGHIITPWDGT